jgi:hypothetical protein
MLQGIKKPNRNCNVRNKYNITNRQMNIYKVLSIRIIEGVLKFLFVHVVSIPSWAFLGVINFVIT